MARKRKGRADPPADPPESQDEQEPEAPPPDEVAALKKELADLRKQAKAHEAEKKATERAKLSEQEKILAELEELRAERDQSVSELGSLRRSLRENAFRDEVQKLAPDVPPRRLRALLKDLEGEGFDIAPEQVTPSAVKKALEELKRNDPDSFQAAKQGANIPGPGPARVVEISDKEYWYRRGKERGRRKRGGNVTGRKAKKSKSVTNRKRK